MNILLDTTSNSKRNQVVTNVQKSQQQRLWPCTTHTNKAKTFYKALTNKATVFYKSVGL